MTEETEIRIPFRDLTRVAFACKECGAEVTIDISNRKHLPVEDPDCLMKCSVCGRDFDSRLRATFSKLFEWYEDVDKTRHEVYFRLKRG
jgi:transcription elongation factor Elf1